MVDPCIPRDTHPLEEPVNAGARTDQSGDTGTCKQTRKSTQKLVGAPKKGGGQHKRAQPRAKTQGKGKFIKETRARPHRPPGPEGTTGHPAHWIQLGPAQAQVIII